MIILRNNRHGEIMRVCMEIFTTALGNKKIGQILTKKYLTLLPQCIACYLTLTTLKRTHLSELSISRFSTYIRKEGFQWVSSIPRFRLKFSLNPVIPMVYTGESRSRTYVFLPIQIPQLKRAY